MWNCPLEILCGMKHCIAWIQNDVHTHTHGHNTTKTQQDGHNDPAVTTHTNTHTEDVSGGTLTAEAVEEVERTFFKMQINIKSRLKNPD